MCISHFHGAVCVSENIYLIFSGTKNSGPETCQGRGISGFKGIYEFERLQWVEQGTLQNDVEERTRESKGELIEMIKKRKKNKEIWMEIPVMSRFTTPQSFTLRCLAPLQLFVAFLTETWKGVLKAKTLKAFITNSKRRQKRKKWLSQHYLNRR